ADQLPAPHGVERAWRLECLSLWKTLVEIGAPYATATEKSQTAREESEAVPDTSQARDTGFEPVAFGSGGDRTSGSARHKLSCVALRQVRVLSGEALVGQKEPVASNSKVVTDRMFD